MRRGQVRYGYLTSMMKLETAQPSCECMPEPQTVRGAASVTKISASSLRSIAFVPFAIKQVLLQRSSLAIGRRPRFIRKECPQRDSCAAGGEGSR